MPVVSKAPSEALGCLRNRLKNPVFLFFFFSIWETVSSPASPMAILSRMAILWRTTSPLSMSLGSSGDASGRTLLTEAATEETREATRTKAVTSGT